MRKDKYILDRFKKAQEKDYKRALDEIKSGRKRTHWMWYIFPQLAGLGSSDISNYYGIGSIAEARAYVKDPVLGPRLTEITLELLLLKTYDPVEILGPIDAEKLRSCMTLFEIADPDSKKYTWILDKYFEGQRDQKTIVILEKQR